MKHPLLKVFLLTYTVTWISWTLAFAVTQRGAPSNPALAILAAVIFHIGVFAPALVALALTDRDKGSGGRATTLALLQRVFQWEVSIRWYIFAVSFMAVVKLSVALVIRVATGGWPRFGTEPLYLMAAAILISTWVQAGEEIGWRGFALPRLSERFGLGPASIVLGIIWASWHLPLFFYAGSMRAVTCAGNRSRCTCFR